MIGSTQNGPVCENVNYNYHGLYMGVIMHISSGKFAVASDFRFKIYITFNIRRNYESILRFCVKTDMILLPDFPAKCSYYKIIACTSKTFCVN